MYMAIPHLPRAVPLYSCVVRIPRKKRRICTPVETLAEQLCGAGANMKEAVVATAAGGAAGQVVSVPEMTTATTNATKANALAGDTSRAEQDTMKATLWKVAVNIAGEGLLGASEARILGKMVIQESPVLMPAFKVGNFRPIVRCCPSRGHGDVLEANCIVVHYKCFDDTELEGRTGVRGSRSRYSA